MISVLNIITDSNIGGAGRVLINYLQNADRSRFEPMVALPRGSLLKEELAKLDTPVYEVDGLAERSFHPQDVRSLTRLIGKLKPDIVHTHGALSGRIAGKLQGRIVIYTRHSAFPVSAKLRYPPGRWVNTLVNLVLADHIIAISPAAAENLTDAGVPARKITVMMNGVSPLKRSPPAQRNALMAELGLGPEDFKMGIIARLEPYKGHSLILDAMERLRREGRNCKLLIAGTGSNEEALRKEASRRGLADSVRFLGFVQDVAPLLSILDLQLNASYGTETSSLSVLEGMSMGLPAVVSSYGGNPWLIDDGQDGLIFESGSAAALKKALVRLMDEPETLRDMGRKAAEIFQLRFTGEIFAKNVESVYLRSVKCEM